MRRALALVVMVVVGGCGRLDFDPTSRTSDGGIDAAPTDTPGGANPLHRYRLAGDYTDDFGGPDLVPLGGTVATNGYTFAQNQGLRLTGGMPPTVYTVLFDFDFETDEGFYTYGLALQFVIVQSQTFATSADLFTPNVLRKVAITRDPAKIVQGYVDGNPQISFTDDADVAALAGTIANFFIDDTATGMGEASAGLVRSITIWDRALTPAEIAAQ